jgi:TetR/AcrR family transcriptional regulator
MGQEKRLTRKERERIARRNEIFVAALDLFSEKGYHNVSMHEIARKAEFAIGTLYKFFENKESLYKSLVLEQVEKFHHALAQAIQGPGDEIEKLRNYVKAKSEIFTANVKMIRFYFSETRGASFNIKAGLDSEIREQYFNFLSMLASVFASGMKKKRFKKISDPYHLAVAIEGITSAFLFLWLEAPDRHPYPEDPDVILNILFKGFVVP